MKKALLLIPLFVKRGDSQSETGCLYYKITELKDDKNGKFMSYI